MGKLAHTLYIWSMVLITVAVTVYLSWVGYTYYATPVVDRFSHPQYDWFKSSGTFGGGLGVIGTILIFIGVVLYITAKKYRYLERWVRLKYLLEFHIFLCTVGPIMILFHTTFKFGGIVSIAFWSMVLVVLSGVIGRYIYLQIPQAVNGRALSLEELNGMRNEAMASIRKQEQIDGDIYNTIMTFDPPAGWGLKPILEGRKRIKKVANALANTSLSRPEQEEILKNVRTEITLKRKMKRLDLMQSLFKYWHVAHRPFALIMLFVVVLHVGVAVFYFGYTWEF